MGVTVLEVSFGVEAFLGRAVLEQCYFLNTSFARGWQALMCFESR